jgi:hypothetical protein
MATNIGQTMTLEKSQPLIRQRYYSPEIEARRRMLSRIDEMLTPEVKKECPGLAIMVLTLDEYEIVMNALEKISQQKKKNNKKLQPRTLTLNILSPNQ